MANCSNCGQPFNGTPWDYGNGGRIHVDCSAMPPPKPKLGVADVGASQRPPARPSTVKKHKQRQRRSAGPNAGQPPTNRTLGKCTVCNRNVQSVDQHRRLSDGYMHANCAAAAARMDRTQHGESRSTALIVRVGS